MAKMNVELTDDSSVDGAQQAAEAELSNVLTVAEIAEEYGLSESAIRMSIQRSPSGLLRQSGATWLFHRREVEKRWSTHAADKKRLDNLADCLMKGTGIPVWGWTGWSEQYVVECSSEADMNSQVADKKSAAIENGHSVSIRAVPEAEATIVVDEYELHGWRRSVIIFVVGRGVFGPDADPDGTIGMWQKL